MTPHLHRMPLPGLMLPAALALTFASVPGASAAQPASRESVVEVDSSEGAAGVLTALKRARILQRDATRPAGPIRIIIGPGEYVFEKPLQIGAEDSGTPSSPLVIEAIRAGTVQFVAAPRASLIQAKGDVWEFTAYPRMDRAAERSGGQLYVNGRRATLARQPNAGNYWLVDHGDQGALIAKPDDIAALAAVIGNDADRAVLSLMQSWTAGDHRIAEIDSKKASISITPKPNSAFLEFGASQRYFVANIPGAFDAPGEWIGDSGVIRYRSVAADGAGGDMATHAAVYWPRQRLLLDIKGTASRSVHDVTLRNIGFAYTGLPTPPSGQLDGQAGSKLGAAIEMNYAKNINLMNCAVSHVGAYAIWLKQGVIDSEISGCLLDDMGAGGVKIGTEESLDDAGKTGHNRILDNVILHTGRQFPGAVGIWIGRSFDNQIASNIVAHTSYTGISVGWAWGYEDPSSGGNSIINNVLFDIGQKTLSDLGAIYTLGRSPGTVVSGNFIRGVDDYSGYGAGAWGIYNDEGSTGLVVKNNVVIDTRSGGYSLNYGRDLEVRDNLFFGGRAAEVRWTSVAKSGAWKFVNNGIGSDTSRSAFTTFNEGEGSPIDTLRSFKAGVGGSPMQVAVGRSLTDISVKDDGSSRVASWRKVIDNARALIARARDAGIRDLD